MELNGIELNEWTNPSTGEVRYYVNNIADLLGLTYETYKTGSISYAELNGEKLSNSKARQLLAAISDTKVWITEDGEIHSRGSQDIAGQVAEVIVTAREEQEAADEAEQISESADGQEEQAEVEDGEQEDVEPVQVTTMRVNAYKNLLKDAEYAEIVDARDEAHALALTGEITAYEADQIRLSFIKRTRGTLALKAVWEEDRKAIAAVFTDCWHVAHERAEAERAAIHAGDRITGQTLAVLRSVMGLSQAELSGRLGISERTLRGWMTPTDRAFGSPSEGASGDVWAMVADWLASGEALIEAAESEEGVPLLYVSDNEDAVQAAAVLLVARGQRFNIIEP